MIRTVRPGRILVPMAVLAALLSLAGQEAAAKPFKVVGAGVGPKGLPTPGQEPRPHWAVGVATHLGLYYGQGTVQTDSAIPDQLPPTKITGEFGSGSPFVFVGANRKDRLVTVYGRPEFGAAETGSFELTVLGVTQDGNSLIVQALWITEFVVQPNESTGKFAGATGSWVMYAYSAPFVLGSDDPVAYWWTGEGEIDLRKRK